jgi:hypothetical protein
LLIEFGSCLLVDKVWVAFLLSPSTYTEQMKGSGCNSRAVPPL